MLADQTDEDLKSLYRALADGKITPRPQGPQRRRYSPVPRPRADEKAAYGPPEGRHAPSGKPGKGLRRRPTSADGPQCQGPDHAFAA
jgi:hypothetical protein